MHHVLICILVLLAGCSKPEPSGDSLPVDADWVPVGTDVSLKRKGSFDGSTRYRLYWVRFDKETIRVLAESIVDCQKHTTVMLSAFTYKPDGTPLGSEKAPTRTFDPKEEKSPAPDSIDESIVNRVCQPPPSAEAR